MTNISELKPISVTVNRAAKITGLSERTIRTLISSDEIASRLVSGRRLVFYDGLIDYIKGRSDKT